MNFAIRATCLGVCLASLFLSCAGPQPPTRESRTERDADWVETTIGQLSLEEKVSQMIVVWSPGRYVARDSRQWQELERLAGERKVGGLVFSVGDVYEYPVQINKLQRLARVPLLIAGDFEYGVAMRVRNTTAFPNAMALGATRDPRLAYAAGLATAQEGRALGVHQNYAPTVDINNNPRNPVINTRSYGDDPALVSEMGAAFVRGTQDGGMIATVKHFPGHGDTDIDSHLGIATMKFSKARLDSFELRPFREALRAGARSVMIGHPAVSALDSTDVVPATVSPNVVTRLLKEELGFRGLIVTDAMEMRGITNKYEPGEAAVLAVKAGIDLVLIPENTDIAIDAIVAAVKRGEIPLSRIEHSVRKILAEKQRMGLDQDRYIDVERVADVVASSGHLLLAKDIARKAVTVLGNGSGILPFRPEQPRKVLDLILCETDDAAVGREFHEQLRDRFGRIDHARIDGGSSACDCDSALARAKQADLIVVQLHFYTRSGEMSGFVRREQCEAMEKLAQLKKPMIAIAFGNPYVGMNFPKFDTYVCAYTNTDVMREAVEQVLFAEAPASGKLPITIPGMYQRGEGVEYPKTRLRAGDPAEAGFDPLALRAVDSVMAEAIQDSAFPGAQLVVARNGIVAVNKAYGALDYSQYGTRVNLRTIYDLASVTKVISTTSAAMRLVDEGKIVLTDPVVKYFPAFGQNGKSRITLYNLLVHNSGLPGWRKFYEFCTEPQCVMDSIFATHLAYPTGDSMVYSDIGLITMGKIVEKVSQTTLDRYVDSVFFKPLGMSSTMYNPPAAWRTRIAPTEVDDYWKKTNEAVRGRVHDENAATLGGVSGHAGLFSTASDLSVILQMLLNGGTYGGTRYIQEGTVRAFITRQSEKSSRGIGWDTKSSDRSFSGRLTSLKTFLHTGFTGTSVVADPEKNLIIVFLTNRVHPTRNNMKIGDVRPRLHNAVVKAILP